MFLTIGMAVYDDFHGAAFTIQSLRLHHDLSDTEIVVVDNHPASPHGVDLRSLCEQIGHGSSLGSVRYIGAGDKTGTTQSRQRIFDDARGQVVLVTDCHVLFAPRAIERLKHWLTCNAASRDLLSGPIILNHGQQWHTHFNDQWRGGMWGTWGNAWHCTCRRGLKFTAYELGQSVEYRDLATSKTPVTRCRCGRTMPAGPWAGHQQRLVEAGFQPLGFSDDDEPFEVPGQGLGVFCCRKDAWPGFNPHFRGFGGEEMYIHEKFRRASSKALCLPFLKWWHRFGNPDGIKYPLSQWQKVRNYVLGHQELGLPLDPVHEHFVGESTFSQAEWDLLMTDPVNLELPPGSGQLKPTVEVAVAFDTSRPQPPPGLSLDQVYEFIRGTPRDLDRHFPLLKELAGQCAHVTEFTKRRESTIAFVAGRPEHLVSYQSEHDILLKTAHELVLREKQAGQGVELTTHWRGDWYAPESYVAEPIEPTDLLYIDTVHHADRLAKELSIHAPRVRRFLVLRGTANCGETSEIGGPGLFHALRPFLVQHPEWFVAHHTPEEYGMTVLSRDQADRPTQPIHAWPPGYGPGTNFAQLVALLGISMPENCTCTALKNQMDIAGPAGCRANLGSLVTEIKKNAAGWGWTEKLANYATAGWKSLTTGLAFKINWADPIPGLVQEAIRRAEQEERRAA